MPQFRTVSVSDITSFIDSHKKVIKDPKARITGFKPISAARSGDLTFITKVSDDYLSLALRSEATLIIVPEGFEGSLAGCKASLIFAKKPRLWFIRCVAQFVRSERLQGVHPTAVTESRLSGKGIYVGPNVYIGKNVTIGDGTVIQGGVQILDGVSVGSDVKIKPGAIIGADGFGFERTEDGNLERFPHIGGVVIEDQAEIGANTCVDRGTLDRTVIGFGTKVDNLVHVGHNAKIGRNCLIAAGSVICGSEVGDNCFVGVGARVKQKVRIGRNVVIGMGAVVLKDVPDNATVIGVPAHLLVK